MKIKYRSGYAEGGFLDDGATVDPMSGNEVPTGSLQEEVRDDIPAQLSEGEFVVPADVVRFIGLDKLMKMRDSAKKGLASMEAEGQIGGSAAPAMPPEMSMQEEPMDIDAMIDGMEDDGMGFAEGGVATYASLMGNEFGSVPTTKNAVYINADGNKVFIPIVEGEPAYAPPEGYTLVVDEDDKVEEETPEEEEFVTPDYTPAAMEGESREDRQIKVDVSNKVQSKRRQKLEALAGANLSQEGIDALYAELTPQAKNIYNDRFRNPEGFLDDFMTEGMSSTDLLITAQKTADSLNDERGVTETDDTSTYSTEPTTMEDMAKAAKYMAAGLLMGPMGLIGAVKQDMTEAEIAEAKRVLSNSFKFFSTSPNKNVGKGRGNQPSETQLTMPTFNQAHWVGRMGTLAGKGLTQAEIQKKLRAEKNAIPALYGTDAYGRKLGIGELSSYNNSASTLIKDRDDNQAKQDRTLAKMAATAARKKKEANIQDIMSRGSSGDKDNNVDWQENIRYDEETKAVQQVLDSQNRRQQSQTTINSGSDGNNKPDRNPNTTTSTSGSSGTSSAVANGPPGRNYKDDSGTSSAVANGPPGRNYKDDSEEDSEDGFMNRGGLASKKKPAVMKMRKDPTAGIAAKKKSKKKAQAKKGALAAKRT